MTKQLYTALASIASATSSPGFSPNNDSSDLPNLLVFTDPFRSPNLVKLAQNTPKGCALVYRHFGNKDRLSIAQQLAKICKKRGIGLFIGADPELADKIGADGVHMPQRQIEQVSSLVASGRFRWISTAAHSIASIKAASIAGAHGIVVSPVFSSSSPSAGQPLGLAGFKNFVKQTKTPVFALGGINTKNIKGLYGVCHGIALVSAKIPQEKTFKT